MLFKEWFPQVGWESITEVAADDAVPGWAVVLVELLLDVLRNVLLHAVLLERLTDGERINPKKKSPKPQPKTTREQGWSDENPIERKKKAARERGTRLLRCGRFQTPPVASPPSCRRS